MSSDPPENKEGEQPNNSGHPSEPTDRLHPIRGHGNHRRGHSYQQPIIPYCGTKVVVTNKSSSSSIPPTTIQISSPTTITTTTTPGAPSSSVITTAITSAGDVTTSIPVVTRTGEASTALTTATAGDTVPKGSFGSSTTTTDSTALFVGTNSSLSKGTPVLVTATDSTALSVGTNSLSKGTPVLVTSSNEAFIGLNIPTTTSLITTTTPSTSTSTATSFVRPVLSSRARALTHPHLHQGRPKRRRPFAPRRTEMGAVAPCDTPGLLHPTGEVNGHARPQGAGVSRDVLGNVSPLLASPTAPTERLIGPVRVAVAPPPLRTAETRRARQRLAFVNQRLMSKPVKRKLWEVDHDTVEADVEAELNQIVEEEERRFREKYEVLKPEKNPHAPRFYYSEVISSKKKEVLVPSSFPTSSVSPRTSSSSSAGFGSTSVHSDSKTSSESITKASSNESPPVAQSTPNADGQRKPEGGVGDPNSSSDSSSVCVTPKPPGQRGVVTEGKSLLLEKQNLVNNTNQNLPDTPSSPLDSPSTLSSSSSSSFSSSLNLSTASRSSSGVSSLESTPTQERLTSQQTVTPTQTITPAGSGTPIQGGGAPPTAERIAPTQETTASTQRATTRSCRQRRSSQRTESGPPRKNLRM